MDKRVLNESEARAWDSHLKMSRVVAARIGRDLAQDTNLSVADHDVLCALAGAPNQRLRLNSLTEKLQWETSRLSHQLRRMERRGLVERHACVEDGRGVVYALNSEGLDAIRAAGPVHDTAVKHHVLHALSGPELAQLAELSEKILANLPQALED